MESEGEVSGTYCTFCGNKLIYCNCYGIREAARKAEGPATKDPEQSPPLGSHSGVVEALRGMINVVRAAGVMNLASGVQLGQVSWSVKMTDALAYAEMALASLPQAPATPAYAPAEGHRVSLPYSTHRQVEGALVIAKYSDESGLVSRTLDLLREDAVYHPEAPAQGVEGCYHRQKGAGNADA